MTNEEKINKILDWWWEGFKNPETDKIKILRDKLYYMLIDGYNLGINEAAENAKITTIVDAYSGVIEVVDKQSILNLKIK